MSLEPRSVAPVHDLILATGEAGVDRYYRALRQRGIAPTPSERDGLLFAPNPVVLERSMVEVMARDLSAFARARREACPEPADLVANLPDTLRETFGAAELAARIHAELGEAPPYALLDGFLREGAGGLEPAYLEWQTFPAYPATAIHVLESLAEAYGDLDGVGASFSPRVGETLADLRDRTRAFLLAGVEDDPREGVLIDFEPASQETAFEFRGQVALTGGERGLGVIDPREIRYREGRAVYERDGRLVPIRSVACRLVADDIEGKLMPICGAEERATLRRFFADASLHWRVHPLHYFYGTKADLPAFRAARLSSYLPACEPVTPELIAAARRAGLTHIEGRVMKPVEGNGGRGVIAAPAVEDLVPGALLQDRIRPAAFHPTAHGRCAPELRLMAIPDAEAPDRLAPIAVYTRVMGPDEFRSNAGAIARRNLAGTGEGFAVFVGD